MNKYLGNPKLTAAAGEPVGDLRNPNLRWAEMWRVLVTFKTLLRTGAVKAGGNGYAVTEYINSLDKDALSIALFPAEVRKLLIDNEKIIANPERVLPWVGHPSNEGSPEPFEGIRIMSGLDMRFGQECPIGPLSIEASFILATQLAGINWKTLYAQLNEDAKQNSVYWMNAIVPYDNKDNRIAEYRKNLQARDLGYLSRRGKPVTGSPDAGFSLVVSTTCHIPRSIYRF